KRYLAIVHGRLEPWADVIDLPLGKHPTVREKYAVRWDPTGKESVTIYRVREVYDGYTLVELELKSGRTHQIRVHLAHLGYPLVGDDMYGGRHLTWGDLVGPGGTKSHSPREPLISRQALHAAVLGFEHPISHRSRTFTAPLPADMRTLVQTLRTYRFEQAPTVAGATVDLAAAIPADPT
ncbi:MAG: RluA family pseudouridine synthase, partial [Planctomycetota bacterium]